MPLSKDGECYRFYTALAFLKALASTITPGDDERGACTRPRIKSRTGASVEEPPCHEAVPVF